jgi:ribonucleoside-diphosphate reductase alpha chain
MSKQIIANEDIFQKNINKWIKFAQYMKFYPDIFYDLIKSEKGSLSLNMDQRVFLRSLSRFTNTYACYPRGYG